MNRASEAGTGFKFQTAPTAGFLSVNPVAGRPASNTFRVGAQSLARGKAVVILSVLLAGFTGLQCLLPLSTAIKIGADEDYELSKATLCNHGYKLYTEIWNDQPPLVTFIIARLVQHAPHSVLAPRLLTVAFAMVLIVGTFVLIRAISGLIAASIATAMLIGSPGFLELSCSVMQEIPAFAPTVAALCLLVVGPRTKALLTEVLAGALLGFGLQMKLIGAAYLPIAGLIMGLRSNEGHRAMGTASNLGPGGGWAWRFSKGSLAFVTSMLVSFIALNYLTGNSLPRQLQQSWAAHFAGAKAFEYGSPQEHGYDWSVPLKNWETTVPALLGLCVLVSRLRRGWEVLPLAWLALTFLVFGMHKPWWAYCYIHNALPLCWCAGVGIAFLWERLHSRPARVCKNPSRLPIGGKRPTRHGASRHGLSPGARFWWRATALAVLGLCGAAWMGSRLYLEEQAIRSAPRLYTCLGTERNRTIQTVRQIYVLRPADLFVPRGSANAVAFGRDLAKTPLDRRSDELRFGSGIGNDKTRADPPRQSRPTAPLRLPAKPGISAGVPGQRQSSLRSRKHC